MRASVGNGLGRGLVGQRRRHSDQGRQRHHRKRLPHRSILQGVGAKGQSIGFPRRNSRSREIPRLRRETIAGVHGSGSSGRWSPIYRSSRPWVDA